MPRSTYLPTLFLTLSVTLMHVSGCATMKLPSFKTDKHVKADAKNPATKVVCIWQPAEGRGLDELPARGFAGQIVFLTANSPTPVEVEGDVTIFLFDDHGTPEQRSQPLHTFRFDEGSWQTYLTPTTWGPTYQLFIPYVRKGLHRASCSLAVQIETPEGRRVTSAMANIVLPGSGSLSDGTSSPYSPQHSRLPAGRVHVGAPVTAGDVSHVVPASALSPLSPTPTGPRASSGQTPKFESFSIPYDFRRANAR
ncbi:MAG: hypothetical protein O3C40_19590 [Planctomycetota bacterium]|nr:hypothetical protein [Planctomycetota bacterium]